MISIDWTLGLQIVNFLVLLTALNVILYRPLRQAMQKRREVVEGSRQRVAELESSIAEKMELYQKQLQAAQEKGNQERDSIRDEALKEEARLLDETRSETESYLAEMTRKVAEQATEARKALRQETETLAGEIAAKILGRAM